MASCSQAGTGQLTRALSRGNALVLANSRLGFPSAGMIYRDSGGNSGEIFSSFKIGW